MPHDHPHIQPGKSSRGLKIYAMEISDNPGDHELGEGPHSPSRKPGPPQAQQRQGPVLQLSLHC